MAQLEVVVAVVEAEGLLVAEQGQRHQELPLLEALEVAQILHVETLQRESLASPKLQEH